MCPTLERASLDGLWLPLRSNVLKHLTISMDVPDNYRPSIAMMASSLLDCHARVLETLQLHDAFRARIDDVPVPTPGRLVMERLSFFDFSGSLAEACQFFERYRLPDDIGVASVELEETGGARGLRMKEATIVKLLQSLGMCTRLWIQSHSLTFCG